jgi:glycosyltransferase involved in cell wall biosynthesis
MAREYEQHGVSRDRLHVLPLFSTVDPQESGCWPAGRVLFAGRMTSLKGGHVLIEAAACAARLLGQAVPLIMVGDGPQREEWQGLARMRGVDADFTGWVEPAERSRLFRRASLVAVPSLWPEPFGLVGLEAAALGLPAVAFDVGGIREWLRHGHNGLLVNPSEGAQGLGAAIAALLASPSDRERMAEAARLVEQTMSRRAHLDRLEPVLAQAGRA